MKLVKTFEKDSLEENNERVYKKFFSRLFKDKKTIEKFDLREAGGGSPRKPPAECGKSGAGLSLRTASFSSTLVLQTVCS